MPRPAPHRLLLTVLAALVATSLLALPGVARAASAPASGTIGSSSPTDTYPTGAPTPCVSQSGTPTHYAKVSFTTDGAAATTIGLTVQPTGFRAVIALYQGGYYPGNSIVNCYNGSAVGSGVGAPVSWTADMGELPAGFTSEPWDLVVWGYSASDVGSFTASVSSTNTGVTVTSTGTPADTTAPEVTVPDDRTVEATAASGAVVPFTATATDAVDGDVTPTCDPASGSRFPLGTTTVTCTATDAAGNVGSASFRVTVRDTTAPVVTVPDDRAVEATAASGAAVGFEAAASDAVDGDLPATCDRASGATFPLGATEVTCRATDAAGNVGSASFRVTVRDTTPPVLTVPDDLTVPATAATGAVARFSPSAVDVVDGAVAVTCDPASGATFPLGTTSVTCRATDAAGNVASVTFRVTVQDPAGPVVTVPEDLTLEATGPAGAVASFPSHAVDAVDGDLATSCQPASGATFALGTTTVTCRATDAAGNVGAASFDVTVRDTTAPVVSVPADLSVPAGDTAGAAVDYTATATDLVDGTVPVACTPAPGSRFAVGVTGVECVATDAAGNTAVGAFSVRVRGVTDPRVVAHVTGEQRGGWYRSPVRVTFSCVRGSAAIVGGCPEPAVLSESGHDRTLVRTVRAADGGTATVRVTVDIDTVAPSLRIAGVKAGRVYLGSAPRARCVGRDADSGLVRCSLRRSTHGNRVTVRAVARDRAGNVSTERRSYVVLPAYIVGAHRDGQRFVVHAGSTYTLRAVGDGPAPVYLQAALEGHRPGPEGPVLQPAGKRTWEIRLRITSDMLAHAEWVVGARFGGRTVLAHLTVRR